MTECSIETWNPEAVFGKRCFPCPIGKAEPTDAVVSSANGHKGTAAEKREGTGVLQPMACVHKSELSKRTNQE